MLVANTGHRSIVVIGIVEFAIFFSAATLLLNAAHNALELAFVQFHDNIFDLILFVFLEFVHLSLLSKQRGFSP